MPGFATHALKILVHLDFLSVAGPRGLIKKLIILGNATENYVSYCAVAPTNEDETRHEFTIAERKLVVQGHMFFKAGKARGIFKGTRTREMVQKCLGVSSVLAFCYWTDYKNNNECHLQVGDDYSIPHLNACANS
eukprot:jgi/Phyca11/114264/e_gw1.25.620.1